MMGFSSDAGERGYQQYQSLKRYTEKKQKVNTNKHYYGK